MKKQSNPMPEGVTRPKPPPPPPARDVTGGKPVGPPNTVFTDGLHSNFKRAAEIVKSWPLWKRAVQLTSNSPGKEYQSLKYNKIRASGGHQPNDNGENLGLPPTQWPGPPMPKCKPPKPSISEELQAMRKSIDKLTKALHDE